MAEWRNRFDGPQRSEPYIRLLEDDAHSNLRTAVLSDGVTSVSQRVPLFVENCEDPGRKDYLFREIVKKLHTKFEKAKRG
jgi:hypothetical protein